MPDGHHDDTIGRRTVLKSLSSAAVLGAAGATTGSAALACESPELPDSYKPRKLWTHQASVERDPPSYDDAEKYYTTVNRVLALTGTGLVDGGDKWSYDFAFATFGLSLQQTEDYYGNPVLEPTDAQRFGEIQYNEVTSEYHNIGDGGAYDVAPEDGRYRFLNSSDVAAELVSDGPQDCWIESGVPDDVESNIDETYDDVTELAGLVSGGIGLAGSLSTGAIMGGLATANTVLGPVAFLAGMVNKLDESSDIDVSGPDRERQGKDGGVGAWPGFYNLQRFFVRTPTNPDSPPTMTFTSHYDSDTIGYSNDEIDDNRDHSWDMVFPPTNSLNDGSLTNRPYLSGNEPSYWYYY